MMHQTVGFPCLAPEVIKQSDFLFSARRVSWLFIDRNISGWEIRYAARSQSAKSSKSSKGKKGLSPNVSSLDTVKFVAEMCLILRTPLWGQGHLCPALTSLRMVSSEFSLVSGEFQTQHCASFHVRFVSMALCHQVCFVRHRPESFASSPRHLARTCTSTLHA